MINLPKYINKDKTQATSSTHNQSPLSAGGRASIRDKLLTQEITDIGSDSLPQSCHIDFPCPCELHNFELTVIPDDEPYVGGVFKFGIEVPLEYNNVPPRVKCLTKIWHPNIAEEGGVCLSLLRQTSLDGLGWAPTRRLKDVVLGLNSLFSDLLDFDDPLNIEAAEQYRQNKDAFCRKVKEYIRCYCKK